MSDGYHFWYPFVMAAFRGIFRLCGGFRVEGSERVLAQGGVILVANHISYADPPAVGSASPRPVWFMAKEPLFRNRVLGWLLRFAHAFPVDQEAVDRHAIRMAEGLLAQGEVLAIFPEGGCSPTGGLQPFFPGAAMIALRTRAPVVPVALLGTNRIMPAGSVLPRPARGGVTIRFGHPLDLSAPPPGLDRREQLVWATEQLQAAVQALLDEGRRNA